MIAIRQFTDRQCKTVRAALDFGTLDEEQADRLGALPRKEQREVTCVEAERQFLGVLHNLGPSEDEFARMLAAWRTVTTAMTFMSS